MGAAYETTSLCRHDAGSSTAAMVHDLRRDGAVVVRGLLDSSTVTEILEDLAPHVEARRPGFRAELQAGFYGANTVRVQGLVHKSRRFVDAILLHPTLLAIADAVLLPHCGDYWMSQAETIYIGPGDRAQVLHRDDVNWSVAAGLGIDLQNSVLVALGDYDAEVGATRVVPRSHLVSDDDIDDADVISVEMDPGDALVYLGATLHGGGANDTLERWRRAIYVSYLLGWLTPEEAVAVSVDDDLVASLPDRARTLLGRTNLRGNPDLEGTRAEVQLWQLDEDDLERRGSGFAHRG